MKNRIVVLAFFVSQFLAGCITFLPPIHRQSTQETVVIISEPAPVIINSPVIIIENPAVTPPLKPEKPVKERPHKQDERIAPESREQNSGRDTNERTRNSGERSRK